MFEVNGKVYKLKYNMKTIEQIEQITNKSLVATLRETEGLLSISNLKIYFGLALYNEDEKRVAQTQGVEIAEALIQNEGYTKVNEAVIVAIDRDCPFLFQVN